MKLALIVIVTLIVGALLAQFLGGDPGYVIINFRGHIFEMSVPMLFILFVAAVAAIWLIWFIVRAPRKLGEAAGRLRGKLGRGGTPIKLRTSNATISLRLAGSKAPLGTSQSPWAQSWGLVRTNAEGLLTLDHLPEPI